MVRLLLLLLAAALGACTSVQGSLTGKLSIQVEGLPPGVEARVAVQPLGKQVAGSQTLELPEGTYEVVAEPVAGPSGERYLPTVEGSPAKVEYGKTAQVRVVYAVDGSSLPGTLVLVVEGLPEGAEARIRVQGEGVDRAVRATESLRLRPGVYTLRVEAVSYAGERYLPSPSVDFVDLPPGGVVSKTVSYAKEVRTGELLVVVSGLPSGVQARVRVKDGLGSTVASLTGSRLLQLPAGVYFVEADPVEGYAPSVSGSPASVQAGGRSEVQVAYQAQARPGFDLSVSPTSLSLRQGQSATLVASIVPRNGFSGTISFALVSPPAGVALSGGPVSPDGPVDVPLILSVGDSVAPGSYALVVRAEGGGVSRTQTLVLEVSPSTGQLALSILFEGAPPGTEGYVVVSGPSGEQVVTQSRVLTLPPGTYTLTAYAVQAGGVFYNPNPPGGTVRVEAGQTASFTITYKASATP